MAQSLEKLLNQKLAGIFAKHGLDTKFAVVKVSDRPDLSDFQCNGALALAKPLRRNPREIAALIAGELEQDARHCQNIGRRAGLYQRQPQRNLHCRRTGRHGRRRAFRLRQNRSTEKNRDGLRRPRTSPRRCTSDICVRRSSANPSAGSRAFTATRSSPTSTSATGEPRWA